ncbi:GIY-YIG nuclease family protein [Pontibacter actiniarum]|uniref:GIY-YIG nuclease family protein n=1 Tax=Pontibacter actiniarum TaxID=323450 RepID=UPI001B7FA419|nr:GIY-YIG nuclease family protein [Pontibacter actiniarum]
MSRPEFDNPGVYCLKGTPGSDSFEERIYIGEAENVGVRIKQHIADSKKDFNELIFFISKDELLTKTQIRYLESRLVQLAIEAKSAEIDNGNFPALPTLHEADISDMEYFLDQVKLILPIMGFKFLISTTIKPNEKIDHVDTTEQNVIYKIRSNIFKAEMYENEKGFIVVSGSQAKKELSSSITETYKALRQKLIDTNVLVDRGSHYEFTADTIFSSPSAAANMILGRQSNGLIEWVNSQNKTYKEINTFSQ